MKMPMKIPLENIQQHINDPIDLFICCASFEERSQSLAKAIGPDRVVRAIICVNEDYSSSARKNIEELKNLYSSKHEILVLNTSNPLLSADHFSETLSSSVIKSAGSIFVDITTFSHEQLLILVRLLREVPNSPRIYAGYTSAKEYAIGLPDDQKWLSQGVDDIRSVLGYPGNLLPSRKLHLIVLVGFESERAEKLIEAYDPAIISLGIGERSTPFGDRNYSINEVFTNRLLDFVQMTSIQIAKYEQFEFSNSEPKLAKQKILGQAFKFPGYNTVVAPMNTKVSTLGAAYAAFEDESLQICYAHPKSYNTQNYSSPSTDCRLFDLSGDLASVISV